MLRLCRSVFSILFFFSICVNKVNNRIKRISLVFFYLIHIYSFFFHHHYCGFLFKRPNLDFFFLEAVVHLLLFIVTVHIVTIMLIINR